MRGFVGTRTWWQWVVAFTLGELVGFGVAALAGLTIHRLLAEAEPATRSCMLYVVAILDGAGEGAVLGWFQVRVMKRVLPRVRKAQWIRNTALAAAFAWALGMLGPTLDEVIGIPVGLQIAISVMAAPAILLSIGGAQALALRGLVGRPGIWIIANALGWLVGLPWTFVLPALLPESSPVWLFALFFAMGGVLMGLSAGALTGAFLPRLGQGPSGLTPG